MPGYHYGKMKTAKKSKSKKKKKKSTKSICRFHKNL